MARMTPAEATAVNIVISYMAALDDPPDRVVQALHVLASRAHNRLQTGWDETAVQRHWPKAFSSSGDSGGDPVGG